MGLAVRTNGKMPDYDLSEFLALDYDRDYVIYPLMPAGGIALLHGKGGHGKTQLAFTIVNEVTRGGTLLRKYPTRRGRVLYFQFDMPEQLFQERLQKASHAFDEHDSIRVVPYHHSVNVLDDGYAEQMEAIVAGFEPDLIVMDTLRKLHPYDENDNAVPSQVYARVSDIAQGASTIIIHHDRKAPTNRDAGDESEEDARESFRGARAWVDDSDLGIRLRMKRSGKILMDFSKLRCAPQETMVLSMNPKTLLLEPKPPETAREWAEETYEPALEKAEWANRIMQYGDVGKSVAYKAINDVQTAWALEGE